MRLINTQTYELEEHLDPGPYAILSHTWREGQEVLYAEYSTRQQRAKSGNKKIDNLCKQAQQDGLDYAWIDTCCIDKSSSAELSEAINSMYAWYAGAEVCYVYMDDVEKVDDIARCRWLSRGWTLQELIAPTNVIFYGKGWVGLGSKIELLPQLVEWTNIDQVILINAQLIGSISAATRMSWAASRQTTRIEDMAYCLLGLFGVNMPLIYGERYKAFIRLQEEVLRKGQDITLLAFDRGGRLSDDIREHNLYPMEQNMLAPSPISFRHMPKIITSEDGHCEVTGAGLMLDVKLIPGRNSHEFLAVLPCRQEFDQTGPIALNVSPHLYRPYGSPSWYLRGGSVHIVTWEMVRDVAYQRIFLLKAPPDWVYNEFAGPFRHICCLQADQLIAHGFEVIPMVRGHSLKTWNDQKLCSEILTQNPTPLLRNFVFMHRLHDEAFLVSLATGSNRRYDWYAMVEVETKPETVDCTAWLHGLLTRDTSQYVPMNFQAKTIFEPTSHNVGDGFSAKLDPKDFIRDEAVKLRPVANFSLLSGMCFANITLSARKPARYHWVLDLTLGDQLHGGQLLTTIPADEV